MSNQYTPDERDLYEALCDKVGCGCCAGDVSARENAALEAACELHDKVNGDLRQHFAALDQSHYPTWVEMSTKGFVCGNVPVHAMVAIIEACRALLQEPVGKQK